MTDPVNRPTEPGEGPEAEPSSLEARALRRSVIGYAILGVAGLIFAVLSRSTAILIDGVFSLISLVMTLLAMRVAVLASSSGNQRFHFGYAHFEPLLNSFRMFTILGIGVFALVSAIISLFQGGRPMNAGIAVFYGIGSAAACLILSAMQMRAAARVKSPILVVDARNWFVDGMLSSAVGIVFIATFVISRTELAWMVPYADPAVVIVLVLAIIKEPLRSLIENFRQVLKIAPQASMQAEVRTRIESCLADFEYRHLSIRMLEIGRFFYALIHVVLPADSKDGDVDHFDRLRLEMEASLEGLSGHPELDVVFTRSDRHVLPEDQTTT